MTSKMARDWRAYWNTAAQVYASNPLVQVGKTVQGAAVSSHLLDVITKSIRSALLLRMEDTVLELCCGNGLITFKVAEHCADIMAIDFSKPLIDTARQRYARENICYEVGDAAALSGQPVERRFDKIFMQEALQFFLPWQVDGLLSSLAMSASRMAPIFLSSIPDLDRLRDFYDTPDRYRQYCESTARGLEPIGTWWRRDDLIALVERHGYHATVLKQDAELHTAHYRFDLLCKPG